MTVPGKASRPTIYDVAKQANVSKSLVSLVLRGSPKVSDKRRAAVMQAIAELGYSPSHAASTLAGSRTRGVGVVIDDYRNLWFVDLVEGMRTVTDRRGYAVTISDRHQSGAVVQDAVTGFLAMNVEGLVIATEPAGLALGGLVPTVIAGGRDNRPEGMDLVANDDVFGATLAVKHLLDLGHERIGHLTGAGGPAARRRQGYEAVMGQRGLPVRVFGDERATTEETGYLDARELLEAHPDTTAIFAANDTMAFGALAALREKGLSVPGDVSIVGYDNSPLAASRYLDLTTIDQQSFAVGIETATALLARIDNPGLIARSTLIRPELVVRSSTTSVRG